MDLHCTDSANLIKFHIAAETAKGRHPQHGNGPAPPIYIFWCLQIESPRKMDQKHHHRLGGYFSIFIFAFFLFVLVFVFGKHHYRWGGGVAVEEGGRAKRRALFAPQRSSIHSSWSRTSARIPKYTYY